MSESIHLAIDAMGGDLGPRPVVLASLALLKAYPNLSLTLVGHSQELNSFLGKCSLDYPSRLFVEHADDIVSMDDLPGNALRHKQQSSMWRCLSLVQSGGAMGCVSGGNTGALMAMSCHLLGTFADIARPAICKRVPTASGESYLLDLGANLHCAPEQLEQFAVMAVALAKEAGCERPKVALLNVGSELTKGVEGIKQAASLLQKHDDFEFVGFVEGNALYAGDVDVIVCDGFVGNVALKVSEGVASFVFLDLKERLNSGVLGRLIGVVLRPFLRSWAEKFNPAYYNGAAFLGLKKTVVKSHGGADQLGFQRAIQTAIEHVQGDIPHQIAQRLAARVGR